MPKVFATPKTLYVPTQYPTIQAAIDDANSGDIISVRNGTYNENLVVNKTISLIGGNPLNTIIDGHGTGRDVINVNNANNVKIERFTIQNGEGDEPASLSIWRSGGNIISNNVIRQSEHGVKVRESNGSNIINNVIVNNTNVGIFLSHSIGNTIMGNLIKKNLYGVRITSVSAPNTFYHNNIINNTHQTSLDSPTKWDNGAEGNFWSDYDGQDLNGDGIGDTPYTIFFETNTDRYPLMTEWSETRNLPFDWKGLTYHTIVQSNSTVASFNFTYSLAQVSFNVTAPMNAVSFCNVTIEKLFLNGTFTVFVDRVLGNYVSTSNSTHASLYFTFIHSINVTCKIQIRGTITVGNPIPIADFTYSPTYPRENQSIQFTSISSDPNGIVVAQSWNFGDGNMSLQQNPVHKYMKKETCHVTLTVTDNEGATGTTMKTILVGNQIPVANFTYSPIDPKENQEIQFNDTSTDSDGTVVAWLWNFGDGNMSSLQHPAYKYANKGAYNVTLTVTDNEGAMNTITKTVVVTFFPADYTLYYVIIGIVSGAIIVAIAFFLLKQKKKP